MRSRTGYTGAPDFWTAPSATSPLPVVNGDNAMTIATAYACIRAIATTVAMLPKGINATSDNGRTLAADHPAHRLIAERPNPYQTPFEFFERMETAAQIYGRGVAIITRDPATAKPLRLDQVPTPNVRFLTYDGVPVVDVNGEPYNFADVLVFSALGNLSPIELHAQTLGLTKRVEKYGADFFESGHLLGVLSSDGTLTEAQMEALRTAWAKTSKKGVKVLPVGVKYSAISLPPEQTQFLTTRKYQDETVCTIFGVPPRVVGVNTQDTKTNGEEQARNFAQRTILPRTEKIRQELAQKLIPEMDRTKFEPFFDLRDMTRGDMKTRAEYLGALLDRGVIDRNEARKMEGMDRHTSANADALVLQSNQITLDRLDEFSAKISALPTTSQTPTNGNPTT